MANEEHPEAKTISAVQKTGLILGPVVSIVFLLFFDLEPGKPEITCTAAAALLMAIWWITEAIPLAATALLPMVLFPALGIMDGKKVAPQYFNYVIFLFIGGFLVALAMERWHLHKRIALRILLRFGIRPRSILLGFMAATAFLSMWISNTATAMMMLPIAMAIIWKLEDTLGVKNVRRYAISVFLGIAYSASIGGVATLVGTPPNPAFIQIFAIQFPAAPEISFSKWFVFAFPLSIFFLFLVWLLLSFMFPPPRKEDFQIDIRIFEKQYRELGAMSFEEWVVLIDFVLLALLWLFRVDFRIGNITIPGWAGLFGNPEYLNDGVVGITMALILFIVPAKKTSAARILDWETATRLPWGIVLLFGGGFALASGFKDSGLSAWVGTQLHGLNSLPPILIIAVICLMITFLTELTSNTASAQILLPLMASLAVAIKVNPLLLMIPGTLSCSCAFMLPVATPPNAIVFGTERLQIWDMVKIGVILNFIGVILITLTAYFWGTTVFEIDLTLFPDWANGQ
jgi:sodium-dependent dicarboxylate transporter 2/3/5